MKQSVCYTHFHSNKVFRGDLYYGRRLQRKNPLGCNVFRIALRDDPDVILIGEMRDYETISLAMMAAETGHLVFGTLHTSSAAQSLVPRSDRKAHVAAVEVMLGTDAVKNHIRSNKIPQMETVMHGSTQLGMQTLTESLAKLYKTGQISYETALEYSNDRTEMEKKLL